jgi:hypothetical protein
MGSCRRIGAAITRTIIAGADRIDPLPNGQPQAMASAPPMM